jgi:hypothetical protein
LNGNGPNESDKIASLVGIGVQVVSTVSILSRVEITFTNLVTVAIVVAGCVRANSVFSSPFFDFDGNGVRKTNTQINGSFYCISAADNVSIVVWIQEVRSSRIGSPAAVIWRGRCFFAGTIDAIVSTTAIIIGANGSTAIVGPANGPIRSWI